MADLAAILRGVLRSDKPAPHPGAAAIEAALRMRIERTSDRERCVAGRSCSTPATRASGRSSFAAGRRRLSQGRASRPSSTVFADPPTMAAVLEGRLAGVQAFLEGRLFLRGNIALALELDDLLPPAAARAARPALPPRGRPTACGPSTSRPGIRGAPPVVLLHGLGATSASFLPTLWDLSRDHHVLAVDLPGFGESDKPVRPLHAAYFARGSRPSSTRSPLDRAHLVGNSMGGRVALEVGAALARARRPPRAPRAVARVAPLPRAAGLVRLLRPRSARCRSRCCTRLVMASLRSLFAHPARVPQAAMNAAADEFVRVFASPRGRIAFFHAAREIYLEHPHGAGGFWDRLPSLERPALFVFGGRDWLVPRAFLRHVRRALPQARCEIFHDCGHVPQFELPDRTHARMREFFVAPIP